MCETLKHAFLINKRYVLGGMGLLALAIALTMRMSLSMTITQMVVKREEGSPDDVQGGERAGNVTVRSREHYKWSEATQGILLSAFYYGYVLTYSLGTILAEKFGGKRTVGYGLLITSVATLITPYIVSIGGVFGLFVIRLIKGCGEGPVVPAFIHLMARWIPASERPIFGAMIFRGDQVGNILGPYISGIILDEKGDWANVFYTFGSFGIIWFIFWTLLCYDSPNTHPYISDSELQFLNMNTEISRLRDNKLDPIPFKAIKRSHPFWALVIAAHGHNWGYFALLIHLPKYLYDVLKYDIAETGYLTMLPFIGMYLSSYFFTTTCQYCIDNGYHTLDIGRKIYTTISTGVPAIFIMVALHEVNNRYNAVAYFIGAMVFMGGVYTSIKIYPMDLAPNYNGPCSTYVNGIAAVAGIITPTLIGMLTPDQTIEQWRTAFRIIFFVLIGTNIIYLIWGSGHQEWWDDVDKYGYPQNWKHGLLERRNEL